MFAPTLYAATLDDHVEPQRGDVDVPPEARRVRRWGCPCRACSPRAPEGWPCFSHADDFFPVYGPPTPHEPRRMATA